MQLLNNTIIKLRRGTYEEWLNNNPIIYEGELIVVTKLPWYLSWFGLKPTALKYGFGQSFTETNFI